MWIFGPTWPRPVPYEPVGVWGDGPKYYWSSGSHWGILASPCKVIFLIFYCFGHEIFKFSVPHPPQPVPHEPVDVWGDGPKDYRSSRSHLGILASLCKVIFLIFYCFGQEIFKFSVLHPPGLCLMTWWLFRVMDLISNFAFWIPGFDQFSRDFASFLDSGISATRKPGN